VRRTWLSSVHVFHLRTRWEFKKFGTWGLHRKLTGEFNLDDSSVGIALGYGLHYRGSRFRLPGGGGAGNFSLQYRVQNGSGAHPASYPMGTRGSFTRGKAAGA
jgi:hypothetical protein